MSCTPASKALDPNATDFAKVHYGPEKDAWRERRFTERKIVLVDRRGFSFSATCNEGTLEITIVTRFDPATDHELAGDFPGIVEKTKSDVLFAKEVIDRMYKYFEDVGNPVRRLEGMWAWGNFEPVRKEFYLQRNKGLSEDDAAAIAVKKARTYPIHERHGFTRVVKATPRMRRFVNAEGEEVEFGVFQFVFERE